MKFFVLLAFIALSGCGYSLQTSSSPALERAGIRTIFVTPLVNNSYKAGVENLVYNALIKTLSGNRNIRLVYDPEKADALLTGTINRASYSPSAQVSAANLKPENAGTRFANIAVATEYASGLECSFTLTRRNPALGKPLTEWAASFSRSKPFPGLNQLGTLGETSALINESEFDRSLGDLAQSMMADVRESLLSRF